LFLRNFKKMNNLSLKNSNTKVGRPKGGRLTEEQRLESIKRTKEYQKRYREEHRPQAIKLKQLINEVSQIKINDNIINTNK